MGWDFTHNSTKADIIEELTKDSSWQKDETTLIERSTLKQATRGNILWTVEQIKKNGVTNPLFIGCYLLARDKSCNGWGYKGMDESVHPYYYSCPLSFLEMVPVVSPEWREKVREHHNQSNKKVEVGKSYTLLNCRQLDRIKIISLRPLHGTDVCGKIWRISKKMIGEEITVEKVA